MCAAGLGVVHPRPATVLRSFPGHEERLTLGTARPIDIGRQYVTQSATHPHRHRHRFLTPSTSDRPPCLRLRRSPVLGCPRRAPDCRKLFPHTCISDTPRGWSARRDGPCSPPHGWPKPGWRPRPALLGSVHGVLSIGKLGAGRAAAEYYLARQAGCPAEYYTGSGERRGAWLGRGAAALGLSGDIDEEALRHLLAGRSPDGSTALVEPVLRADPRGRLPAGPLAAHVRHLAALRDIPAGELLDGEQGEALGRVLRAVARDHQAGGPPRATVRADVAASICRALGLDPREVYAGHAGRVRCGAGARGRAGRCAGRRVRRDPVRAEVGQRPVRPGRPCGRRGRSAPPTSGPSPRRSTTSRAEARVGVARAPRRRAHGPHRGHQRPGRGGVSAPGEPVRGPAAAHPRRGREPGPRGRRAGLRVGLPVPVRGGEDRRLPVPGGAAPRAHDGPATCSGRRSAAASARSPGSRRGCAGYSANAAQQIEALLAGTGRTDARAAQEATLATRPAKRPRRHRRHRGDAAGAVGGRGPRARPRPGGGHRRAAPRRSTPPPRPGRAGATWSPAWPGRPG